MFCTGCGTPLPAGQKFCTNCGARADLDAGTTSHSPKPNPSPTQSPTAAMVTAFATPPVPAPGQSPAASPPAAAPTPAVSSASEAAQPPVAIPGRQPSLARQPAYPRRAAVPGFKSPILLWGTLAIVTLLVIGGVLYFYGSHQTISDAAIVENVKAKLYDDANLRKCTIDVTSQKGIVTLVGLVNTDADRTNAVNIAKQIQAVKQVVDQLVVQTAGGSSTPIAQPAPRTSSTGQTRTIEVPGYQGWTPTGIQLSVGDSVEISASGAVTMSVGWAPTPPAGVPPNCGARGGFPAGQLPCWSLIGRIGEQGAIFYVGSSITFRAPTSGELFLGVNDDILGDNRGSWTATVSVQRPAGASSSNSTPSDLPSATAPRILQSIILPGATFLQLSPAPTYLFAMVTEGGRPSSPFAVSEHIEGEEGCEDAGHNLFAQIESLSRTKLSQNSYATQTADHVIGGASIGGSFSGIERFSSGCLDREPTAGDDSNYNMGSVNFTVKTEDSLVVLIGLSNGAWHAYFSGISGLQSDSSTTGGKLRMLIAHAYLHPGSYTVNMLSFRANEQPPRNLVGAFVFEPKG